VDSPNLLAANSNTAIHTRVKSANGLGYVIAYNYTNAPASTTFTWGSHITRVDAYNEGRSLASGGMTFSDSFGPYEAHVYVITP
jgi:hypothetical protein